MKKALLIGIDDYPTSPLSGCVEDANKIENLLSKNEDGSPNFVCKKLTTPQNKITRALLKRQIKELFDTPADIALLYFSGHGTENNLGGYLVTPDAEVYDEGVTMTDVLTFANNSQAKEIVIILDSCNSGAFGAIPAIGKQNENAVLREGISILTASRSSEPAIATGSGSVFTSLICDALDGGAVDVLGKVTVASIYAYADQTLGPWDQRPLFKSHVSKLCAIRMCEPQVKLEKLRLLPEYFPTSDFEYSLDPSYEPDRDEKSLKKWPRNVEHQEIFANLQKYRSAHLVEPVDEEHMYYAAMNSKKCRLTPLGRFYWSLANRGKI